MNIPNGRYDLGLARPPTLLYRIELKDGQVSDIDRVPGGMDWCMVILFILRSGQCSVGKITTQCKYLLLEAS